MIDGNTLVEQLIVYAKKNFGLLDLDEVYITNLLLTFFKLNSFKKSDEKYESIQSISLPDYLIVEISEYAIENKICSTNQEVDQFANFIMGILTPNPSVINKNFYSIYNSLGVKEACNYLYNLCKKNYYIRQTDINKNLRWDTDNLEVPLEITINLSKPEKNNKDIAKLISEPQAYKYPQCALCIENEGYLGNANHPSRTNLRTIRLNVQGKTWYMQYSPYSYYNEHCIFFNKEHVPMQISKSTIENLLDIIDIFPNYFVGSNSDLPIVGGSILNHEHYQGGGHLMPLQKAKPLLRFMSKEYPELSIDIVDFYNSVIRVTGNDRKEVSAVCGQIIDLWKIYSDETVDIIASTNGVRHNTVTPIARLDEDGRYSVDLILRNNRTNDTYPDGIYHAHPEYHNIKKEGIGLIEAMGLFILPARLKRQFNDIANIMCKAVEFNLEDLDNETHDLFVHRDMIKMFLQKEYSSYNEAMKEIYSYVNETCANILRNVAVYKNNTYGQLQFTMFLTKCGFEKK